MEQITGAVSGIPVISTSQDFCCNGSNSRVLPKRLGDLVHQSVPPSKQGKSQTDINNIDSQTIAYLKRIMYQNNQQSPHMGKKVISGYPKGRMPSYRYPFAGFRVRGGQTATSGARESPATPPLWAGLRAVQKKPRAVWNAQAVRAVGLPAAFWGFAKKLGSDYEVVKLLRLMAEYGIPVVLSAMEAAASVGPYAYEAVRTKLELGQCDSKPDKPITDPLQIKQVDLSAYDSMLAGGKSA